MRNRVAPASAASCVLLSLLLCPVLTTSGCTAPAADAPAAARPSPLAVGCPECFTIIECVRMGPMHQPLQRWQVQCERCCETLTFATTADGQLTRSEERRGGKGCRGAL